MLKLQYFGHLMRRVNSLEKTQMRGKIEGKRRKVLNWLLTFDSLINSFATLQFNYLYTALKKKKNPHQMFSAEDFH